MTHPVLVLQHAPWERPGLISQALAEGAPGVPGLTRTVAAEPRPNLPAARDLAGLVVMGGSMNAEDDAHFPGLAAERRLLAEAVDTAVPVLGVCLGLQFHLEMDQPLPAEWLTAPPMVADLAQAGITDLREQGDGALPTRAPRAVVGLAAFAAAVRERSG